MNEEHPVRPASASPTPIWQGKLRTIKYSGGGLWGTGTRRKGKQGWEGGPQLQGDWSVLGEPGLTPTEGPRGEHAPVASSLSECYTCQVRRPETKGHFL